MRARDDTPKAAPPPERNGDGVISVAVALAAFAAYLFLAPPVSGDRDSSEFTVVLAANGVAHPTGYVLYTVLGHGFVAALRALGAPGAWAANAFSALGGGVAMGLLHATAARFAATSRVLGTPARTALPLVCVALIALGPAWTQVTTVAEVYSWHVAWALALTWLAVGRLLGPGAPDVREHVVWGVLVGAGLAHHATSVFFSVPLTAAYLLESVPARERRGALVRVLTAAAMLPVACAVWLWLHAGHDGPGIWRTLGPGWAGVWAHVSAAQYAGHFGRFAPEPLDRALIERHVFPPLFAGLAALVLAWALTPGGRARAVLAVLLGIASAQALFAFGYGVEDPSAYFLPALVLGVLALAPLACALTALRGAGVVAARSLVGVAALAALPGLATGWRTAVEARATFVGLDAFVHEQWERIPIERGIVFWPRDLHQRLIEYQLLRGEKPGLEIWNPRMLTHPEAKRRFFARHGFDPVGDLRLRAEDVRGGAAAPGGRAFAIAVAERVNERTALPVVLFEPEIPAVTVLPERPAGNVR
ncbi:MAG: DUF2723 domain-containing protein [Candidatus Eisenbacteria bacterium]|uniref:DUF2723 domain-containing protein n=1 Tax=Eiseniibacteriota bacterium TaxID=2212470 RepID=A0A933W202_UNCEI|nr:DUF2723 domain-containing protein [Candidatus Eisenbacteria bacterium]